ncbi:hypothetical protein GCM10027447_10760 [Glycomyces halotolerans]
MVATKTRQARLNPGERTEKSEAIHTELDRAGALMNAAHAQVLKRVIEAKDWNIHRDFDGFSALRDWLMERFDFHVRIAADLAAIARLSRKFTVLTETATTGAARIDRVAYAVRQFEHTTALRRHATTPYPAPVTSPFDEQITCPTPEALAAQYCIHAPFSELKAHLAELEAALTAHDEVLDDLSQQTLQRLDIWQTGNGMWAVDGLLTGPTGLMLDKALKTAVPPPRQDETDEDGILPAAANRNAEALHHMLGVYGSDPKATRRHGETCQLNLTVDVETLQGVDTGRVPTLEGRPISLAMARLLACEASVVPMVFDYRAGEALELGRAERLPNAALRRKLVAEQPRGCAWSGCGRPSVQCEAHHIRPWWAGGETNAENLILLCRFHHGRVHTPDWTVSKTAPGQALTVHHEGHEHRHDTTGTSTGGVGGEGGPVCGCEDWRSDADLDADFADDIANVFPTGLYPEEWGPKLRDDLNTAAETIEQQRLEAEIRASRARLRKKFAAPATQTAPEPAPEAASGNQTEAASGNQTEPDPRGWPQREPVSASASTVSDLGPPPFLGRPARMPRRGGSTHTALSSAATGSRAFSHARLRKPQSPPRTGPRSAASRPPIGHKTPQSAIADSRPTGPHQPPSTHRRSV